MDVKDEFTREVRRTALLSVGLLAALTFGIIILAGGDSLPGAVIVGAGAVGLAKQVPVVDRLCRRPPPPPADGTPTG